ncbi:unnamed protein product [Spirodela intermedia]|uniref:Bromo domain-containing protein n=1 Tax=Spirodela intermedia TaxID=51605 RepID=A0A7I8K164_SPIIN|nr:unnamed protein product [Spirodela intermedia]
MVMTAEGLNRNRRSARLQELEERKRVEEANRAAAAAAAAPEDGQPSSTVRRRGRKRKHVFDVTVNVVNQELRTFPWQSGLLNAGRPITDLNGTPLPCKKALESVLDVLQMMDFEGDLAMPGNLQDRGIEDNLRDPQDLGTVRAKLHERFYATLEQFEKDVYSVTSGAKLPNPPESAIHKLATEIEKKAEYIFNAIRTQPGFELRILNWARDNEINGRNGGLGGTLNLYRHFLINRVGREISYEQSVKNFLQDAGSMAEGIARRKIEEQRAAIEEKGNRENQLPPPTSAPWNPPPVTAAEVNYPAPHLSNTYSELNTAALGGIPPHGQKGETRLSLVPVYDSTGMGRLLGSPFSGTVPPAAGAFSLQEPSSIRVSTDKFSSPLFIPPSSSPSVLSLTFPVSAGFPGSSFSIPTSAGFLGSPLSTPTSAGFMSSPLSIPTSAGLVSSTESIAAYASLLSPPPSVPPSASLASHSHFTPVSTGSSFPAPGNQFYSSSANATTPPAGGLGSSARSAGSPVQESFNSYCFLGASNFNPAPLDCGTASGVTRNYSSVKGRQVGTTVGGSSSRLPVETMDTNQYLKSSGDTVRWKSPDSRRIVLGLSTPAATAFRAQGRRKPAITQARSEPKAVEPSQSAINLKLLLSRLGENPWGVNGISSLRPSTSAANSSNPGITTRALTSGPAAELNTLNLLGDRQPDINLNL